MSPARRSARKRDWPRGLYEPRPGYYVWRHPDGRTLPIGRVSLAVARNEAIAANLHVQDTKPGLVERLSGAGNTINELLQKMPAAKTANTAKAWRSLHKKIATHLGTISCSALSVADCARAIEHEAEGGKARTAEAFRSRLITVCRKGMALGWMETNPALSTEPPDVEIQRGRLTLDAFRAIYAKAPEVSEWLQHAMRLALVTGADRSTVAGLQRSDIGGGYLTIRRSKTGAAVAIPLTLRLEVMGWTLSDILAHRTGVVSRYLVHHVNPWGNAPTGSKVHPDRFSHCFTEARKLAGIKDKGAPTFHEIRSLASRLYLEQGNVDVKALLGHATQRMSDMYANPRGVEPIRVRISGAK